jgi:hypothetical protein
LFKIATACWALMLLGCSGAGGEAADESGNVLDSRTGASAVNDSAATEDEAAAGEIESALCLTLRDDYTQTMTVVNGDWGTWAECSNFCPAGTYVYEIAMKALGGQGSGDDVATTGFRVTCRDPSNFSIFSVRTPNEFNAGSWLVKDRCSFPDMPLAGARALLEAPQGTGDDTGINGLKKSCLGAPPEVEYAIPSLTSWGTWRSRVMCPAGQAVCGINTRIEGTDLVGSIDDTAVNGLKLACCWF